MSSSDNNDESATANWTELPSDLVCQILGRLEIADFIRFAAVCRPWNKIRRINSKNCRPKASQLPWLMFSSRENPDQRYFYSLTEQRMYSIHLPQIKGLHVIGSSDGFIVSVNEEACLHITNPITGDSDALPLAVGLSGCHDVVRDPSTGRITDYRFWDVCPKGIRQLVPAATEDMGYFFHKAVVVASPTFPSSSTRAPTVFVFFSFRESIAFARPGDTSWRTLSYCETPLYDLIFHKGRLHAVDFTGRVVVYDDIDHSLEASFVSTRGPLGKMEGNDKRYLVESPDGKDLFLIYRDINEEDAQPKPFNRTAGFQVFVIDGSNYTWTPIRDVGEISIFLGYNRSMAFSVKEFPQLKRNCIYFTDDLKLLYLEEPDMAGDMGICDLGDGSIYPLVPSKVDLERLNWPPALWFTPALS